jgi:hypothetical protein
MHTKLANKSDIIHHHIAFQQNTVLLFSQVTRPSLAAQGHFENRSFHFVEGMTWLSHGCGLLH